MAAIQGKLAPHTRRVSTALQQPGTAPDAPVRMFTALGTLPVLLSQKFSQRSDDTMLGFIVMMLLDTALS